MNTIGERVKWLRSENKLNQKEFSEAIKVGQSRLSEVESNKTKPSFDTLYSIKEVFKVSLDWLIYGEGEAFTGQEKEEDSLTSEERELISKVRSGLQPVFDNDIRRLTGEVGRLNDMEHDIILKFRELGPREQEDIYDNVNWKYEKILKKKMSSSSTTGGKNEGAATSETA